MEFTFNAVYSQEYCITIEADSFEEAKKKLDDPDFALEECDTPYLENSYCRDEDGTEDLIYNEHKPQKRDKNGNFIK